MRLGIVAAGKANTDHAGISNDPAIFSQTKVLRVRFCRTSPTLHLYSTYASIFVGSACLLRALTRSEALLNGKFLFCFFFVPRSLERRSKCVVDRRISRRETLRAAQRRNCLFIFF